MSALLGLVGQFWPYIVSGAGILLGLLYGFVKGTAADTRVAQAGQKVAESNAQTARIQNAESQANAAAAQAGAESAKERANAESDIASLPAGSAADRLRNDWAN